MGLFCDITGASAILGFSRRHSRRLLEASHIKHMLFPATGYERPRVHKWVRRDVEALAKELRGKK